ncbi:hypothetical protein [Bacteroides pyogenes]|uniref:hypothetical protein n=1 Tax=Bacteroides pyogenes TaxID=310300 RepID=UPI002FDB13F4
MAQICTTREQSKRLLELGISRETADMFYPIGASFPEECDNGDSMQADHPAWSLGALISVIPEMIEHKYTFQLTHFGVYYCDYDNDAIHGAEGVDVFKNCINMIEWLVKKKYIKTK